MARLSVQSEAVRHLVNEKVIPLYLATGNIAALTKVLNTGLDESGAIHANRVHALLSDDVSRGLNESTVEAIARAADQVLAASPDIHERAEAALQQLKAKAHQLVLAGFAHRDTLAEEMGVPPAVAALLTNTQGRAIPAKRPEAVDVDVIGQLPDWSYQDTAVARCMEAFVRRPTGRIGLILPTGAGKTRTALRVVCGMLQRARDSKEVVYWVTHRRNLREQAFRELQKLSASGAAVAIERLPELANRIKFVMVGDLTPLLDATATKPALIVIDEAHHAAALSYQPIFANPWGVPVLLLTATPNRGDRLPIGMDEIAFTITYSELAERRAVLTPHFRDFPVENFDWSSEDVANLADYIIDSAAAEFTKVLVLAPRIDRVQEFHRALVDRLPPDHPLEIEDLGFVHGSGNSLGINNEDFLARFGSKPRGILVSAQLLLEGFDDPSINTVVLTYPSTSVIRLMQAAGRCVRFAPGKRTAYVVQARNDKIAYHFDQRWLYQEIDDFLRPQLHDIDYGTRDELANQVASTARSLNVEPAVLERITARVATLQPGETCRLFAYGLPYFGESNQFVTEARWGVVLETPETSSLMRSLFNGFCNLGADLSDPSDYLLREGAQFGISRDLSKGSRWLEFMGLLTASYFAKREIYGPTPLERPGSRPYHGAGPTTWLRYYTFNYRPQVPAPLADFLRDCHNAAGIEAAYIQDPASAACAVKVPLPLGGNEAFLLRQPAQQALELAVTDLRNALSAGPPESQFGAMASFLASNTAVELPARLLMRSERLLDPLERNSRVLPLSRQSSESTLQESTP